MPVRLDSIEDAAPSQPMRLSDVSGGAKPMRLSDVQGEPAPAPKKKSSPFMETATDIGMVYPALEAAAHAITGFVGGFPGYLGGGVGQIINRALGRSDELPSEVGKKVGEAFTYQPKTERGKRLAGKVMSPFTALTAAGESGGHAVTDVTGSPAAGALTEGTIQMAPAFLGGPMARAHEATMPKFTGREAVAPKPGQFAPPGEEAPRAPTTGTSSGVPIRLDKLIAEAESLAGQGAPAWTRTTVKEAAKEGAPPPQQGATPLERSVAGATYDWQVPPPPDVAGAIRDIKAAGPQPGQANLPIGETIRNAAGELDRPPAPEAPAGPETPYVGAFEKPKQDNLPFRRYEPDKEYPARPIVIPRSEVRGGEGFSGGKPRKVYELVQTNTPFERVLANSGREWETKAHQDTAREELVAAVRQMSPEDAARFGKLQGLPPEKLMEAAKQYWANIRTDLNNARLADPESSSVQIEAPDAERALFYGKDEPPGRAATADLSLGPDEIGAPPVEGSKTRVDPPEMRESIIAMKDEIGAAETGGKLLIDETTRDTTPGTGEVMGRTPWVGSRWWFDRPDKLSASEARNAIDKYLRGEKLGKRQQGFIDYTRYEIEDRMNEGKAEPGSDQAALDEFGPGTLGANPMLNTKLLHELADTGIKKSIGWANAIQSASETAKKAIAPIFQYARAVQAAKETAQRDVIGGEARAAEIRADYVKSMDEALRANPRFQTVKPETLKEAAREIERAKREIAAGKMRRWLLDNGYAIRRHADEMPGSEDVFREPTLNIRDLHDATGRPLLLREDIIPLAEQMVGAHDISQQRAYAKSWVGKAESMNHATVSWLMQNPLFHLVTTAGKATAYTVPAAGRSGILNYMKTAGEAINDRAQLADMVQHGMQPFPVRHKMEPTGAEAGAFERGMKAIGFDKPYEAYQWMHRHVLANSVNRIQTAFYQMRLEQLIKQAQGEGKTLTPEMVDTFKTTAAQESNPIGGNLPKEEMNQTLYRGLGLTLFSRGLQASTTRMLTRTVENNEIVRSIAKKNGFTDAEAKLITDRNRHFLMAGLALDYAVMQTVANALNYATTSLYDEPDKDGKPGGHFVWDNPGATNASRVFPNSIFLKPKTDDAGNPTGEGIYISNPIRTVRDIIEYAMIPFQVGGGGKPQVLFNKFSPLANLGKTAMTGADWAGRPLSGPTDVAAEVGSMAMPAPLGDVPRYAAEAARSGNQSFLTEGIKRAFDPETAIPTLLGMQPRVSSKDPTTTQEAADQSNDEKKLWARVSRVKQLSKRIDPEVREKQIEAVLEDARKLHMSGSKISEIARVMRNQGVSKAQRSAQGRAQARKADEAPQLDAPPL